MKSKLINWNIFDDKKSLIEEQEQRTLLKKENFNDNIQFHIFNKIFDFDFGGVKIVQSLNTNKFLRCLFDDYGESLIYINGIKIRSKNIIIISPLTRISDIVSSKTSGDINKFLKDHDVSKNIEKINNIISEIYNSQDECLKNITDIDLTKTELINYLDVKDDFIDEHNIIDILNILKNSTSKKLIIFNDIEYLSIQNCEEWLNNFDFLYIMNNFEKNWEKINNYNEFSLIYDDKVLKELQIEKLPS